MRRLPPGCQSCPQRPPAAARAGPQAHATRAGTCGEAQGQRRATDQSWTVRVGRSELDGQSWT
eukprot:1945904-Prymnesium_polylepis.1